jgi:hypothetical protein
MLCRTAYIVSQGQMSLGVYRRHLNWKAEKSKRTERAVRFRMIVDGTVLAPLHTGLLKRRLVILVSNVQSFKQSYLK